MASPSWTQSIDDMFTSTWAYRKDGAILQSYEKTPFWAWLSKKNRIKNISGYRRIEINLKYGKNETATWLTKGGTVPLTENTLLTVAYEDWKYIAVNILRYGVEDQQNRGSARIVDYVKSKLESAEIALDEAFESVVFSDGTGSNEPNGVQNLVSSTPTTGTSSGVTSVYLLSDMRTMMNDMTKQRGIEYGSMFVYTTQDIFEAYEDELLEVQKYTSSELIDKQFESLTFKGRPIMWAPSCPSGNMYFLNPEYLYVVIDPGFYMDMTEWKAIPDQVNDKVAQILCTMQLVTSRPIAQGVMTSITVG